MLVRSKFVPTVFFMLVLTVSADIFDLSDDDQFGDLSKYSEEDLQRILDAVLKDIDADGDQVVEKAELKAWIEKSSKLLKKLGAEELFDKIDEDDDNEVTWEEIFDNYKDEKTSRLKELFNAADIDDDSQLKLDEYVKFRNPTDYPELKEVVVKQLLEKVDRDGDGRLSFEESKALGTDESSFDSHDADDDGFLDDEEIGSIVEVNADEILAETLKTLMPADDNKDGELSIEELSEEQELAEKSVLAGMGEKLINKGKIALGVDRDEL